MIDFLIKSSASLFVFITFYRLVLEREKMHYFNRFYLIITLLISLLIPFVTYQIIEIIPIKTSEPVFIPKFENIPIVAIVEKINYIQIVLWGLHGIITALFMFRFVKNVWKLIQKSKSNATVKYKNATLVLIKEKTLAHSFLNFIFINFDDYNNRTIEDELYTHELVHVTQKHTLDILFIETLKVVFWFNPLFYFYKKAIQLNHEFLADEKVVTSFNNVTFYQNLLLQKSSNVQTIYLASNLNYLITKKRLIMMTKNTSQKITILKKIAIVPVLAGLIYFFCVEIVAQKKFNNKATKAVAVSGVELGTSKTDDERRDKYYKGVRIILTDNRYGIEIDKIYDDLTLEQKRKYLNWIPNPMNENKPTKELLAKLSSTNNNAIWINESLTTCLKLKEYKTSELKHYTSSLVHKNARSKKFPQEYQYHFYTNDYFDKNLKNLHLKFSNDTLKLIFSTFDKIKKYEASKNSKTDTLVKYSNGKKEENFYLQDTVKKKSSNFLQKPLQKVKINGEVFEKVEDKYFNEKGSFDSSGKTKLMNGYIKINNQTCFYVTDKKGEIEYFNRSGIRINRNGEKIEPNTITEVPTNKQETTDVKNLIDLTEKPDFIGGVIAFYKYVGLNFNIPDEISQKNLNGKVFVHFIIEKDGSLSNIKVLKDMGYGTGEEAIRILKESPKWKPGKIKEEIVRTHYSLPITIQTK